MQWHDWYCYQHHVMLMSMPMAWYEQRSHVTPPFDYLDLWNKRCHWHCHLESGDTGATGIACLCQWYYITKKSCIAPHFNYLDLQNEMLPLTMPSAPCDGHARTWCHMTKKSYHVPHFSWHDLGNAMVSLMMLLALCNAGANGVTWLKETM